MPTKKKKYNARFPAGRIKKIMQTDEEVGKVAQAVPVIISRTLELFVESLLRKAMEITSAKNAKTLSPSHMKQCILSESRFDFLKDLVKNLPDVASCDGDEGNAPFLSSPPSGNTAGYIEMSSSTTTTRQPETGIKREVGPAPVAALPSHPHTVITSQLHANFYKETDAASPSYGQVPVASEVPIGRSSVLHMNPAASPQPGAAVVPAADVAKPERIEPSLLNSSAAGINPVHSPATSIGAFAVQAPLVIPQYVRADVSAALDDDDCDTT